jgi:ribulose-phosphate 3-epimerase
VAVKPGTDLAPYLELLTEFDQILVMTVEPGFGGQSFLADMMGKVAAARAAIDASGIDVWLQVDGGIALDTIGRAAEAGADTFVAGSAVYGAEDAAAAIADLRAAASAHAH